VYYARHRVAMGILCSAVKIFYNLISNLYLILEGGLLCAEN